MCSWMSVCELVSCVDLWECGAFFVFKRKTAYEMRISDWSSDVCSSDLVAAFLRWGRRRIWLVITYFPATITTFSIIRCSGRTSEPMRNGDSTRTSTTDRCFHSARQHLIRSILHLPRFGPICIDRLQLPRDLSVIVPTVSP